MSVFLKTTRKNCVRCNTYTIHELSIEKKNKQSPFLWILRQKKRRGKRGNKGKFSKVPSRSNKTKRPNILLECTVCNRKSHKKTRRAKKVEIITK